MFNTADIQNNILSFLFRHEFNTILEKLNLCELLMECDNINTATVQPKTMSSRDPKSAEVTPPPSHADLSASNVTNTPIIYKVSDASNYSSKKQHRVDANELLTNEIMDKFLEPMLSDLLLKWYLPLDKPNLECLDLEWLEICKEMKEARMYPLFVYSISALVS